MPKKLKKWLAFFCKAWYNRETETMGEKQEADGKVGKQFWKTYWRVIVCMLASIAALSAVAGYTVGVVSVNNVIADIDRNIGSVDTYLEKNEDATTLLFDEFQEEYTAKTRTIALLLSQDASFAVDDRTLEELRVTVNADRISVIDRAGNVTVSTDPSGEGATVREEFRAHLSDTVYTDVLFLLESDTPTIVAASSLENGEGLVQITFSADSAVSLLQEADLANVAIDMPLYVSGTTSILDADTLEYISCTDSSKIGTTATYDKSTNLSKNKGRFDFLDDEGNRQMLHYQLCGDYIVIATVPYSDIYYMRNVLVWWLICGGLLLTLITGLSLRMKLLKDGTSV